MYQLCIFVYGKILTQPIWVNNRQEAVKRVKLALSYATDVVVQDEELTENETIDIIVTYNSNGIAFKRHFTLMN